MPQNKTLIHPIDRQAGELLRQARLDAKMTQDELARRLGISFQQIQKYEKGLNRISTSRLVGLAFALGISPASLLPCSTAEYSVTQSHTEHRAAKIARGIQDQQTLTQWLDLGERLTIIRDENTASSDN